MNILVSGADGLLGEELRSLRSPLLKFNFFNKDELDITDECSVQRIFAKVKPDVFVNAAAYTNVDLAETEKETALNINAKSLEYICRASKKFDTTLLHVSTDQVFTGDLVGYQFHEDSPVSPINHYGYTKAQGEKIIQENMNDYYILRTSWLYGGIRSPKGFVNKFLGWAQKNHELKIVDDEIGSPTYAKDLAIAILHIILHKDEFPFGIYHCVNEGYCSRYELALEIKKILDLNNAIIPSKLSDFARPAKISNRSVLVNTKYPRFRYWQGALLDYLSSKTF